MSSWLKLKEIAGHVKEKSEHLDMLLDKIEKRLQQIEFDVPVHVALPQANGSTLSWMKRGPTWGLYIRHQMDPDNPVPLLKSGRGFKIGAALSLHTLFEHAVYNYDRTYAETQVSIERASAFLKLLPLAEEEQVVIDGVSVPVDKIDLETLESVKKAKERKI
jgi:hypothetical protein